MESRLFGAHGQQNEKCAEVNFLHLLYMPLVIFSKQSENANDAGYALMCLLQQ